MKKIVFDIGANKGWETDDRNLCSYHTKRPWVENYTVVCVEPTPELYDELCEKYKDQDVHVVHAAVTDDDGPTVDFWVSASHTASTCSKERVAAGCSAQEWNANPDLPYDAHLYDPATTKQMIVPTTRIDTLVEKYGRPSFIKVDVEGYEYKVLNTFKENYCPISFEWSEQERGNLRKSMMQCNALGYTKYWITFGNLGIQNDIKSLVNAMQNCDYWNAQGEWMVHCKLLIAGVQSYDTVMDYVNNACVEQRVFKVGNESLQTDCLWGQIYAE